MVEEEEEEERVGVWDDKEKGKDGGGQGGGEEDREAAGTWTYEKRWTASQRSLMLSFLYFMKSRSVSKASSPTETLFS